MRARLRKLTQRHRYVLESGDADGAALQYRFKKAFHVSPFLPMAIDYTWRFGLPGENLAIHMRCEEEGDRVFDATLGLRRRELSHKSLTLALVRHPFMTLQVSAGIYFNAFRTAPGRLTVSGTLAYQMMAGRLAQLCAFLMDEQPAGDAGAAFLKQELTSFLGPLAGKEPDKAVTVEPVTAKGPDGNPVKLAQVTVQPDARIESMDFKFVFQLPLK